MWVEQISYMVVLVGCVVFSLSFFGIAEKTRCFRRKLFEIQKAFKSMMSFHDLMDLCFKSSSLKSQFFDGVIF